MYINKIRNKRIKERKERVERKTIRIIVEEERIWRGY